ncbi:hypothetical protein bcgnr5378_29640 [Bacillus cereus]|uniref:Prepilin type IV endopeptidase peptidase domain-containing protein n=1 Tax=Bacillus cereus TaxID=1396 RepID=A0A164QT56_BACCE|nr:hypothetical protein [Bacillus cereus]KZD72148.1 hypothetical protein B4088_0609 [Bacillus cereus]HDR8322894.1 hypothetical protein [Bacillus cereus]HDR8331202.1 hypothetical protein [Bacillus cereus]HDR8332940.1 hypothetical protein [Bacillus cereus]
MNTFAFLLVGLLTFVLVIGSFHKLSKTPYQRLPIIIFGGYVLLSMWFMSFTHNPVKILLLLPMFYTIYDDMHTKSFNILFPIFSFISLLAIDFDMIQMATSVFVFSILRLTALVTKNRMIGAGDAYFLLPISYFLTLEDLFTALFLSCVIGFLYIIIAYGYKKWKKQDLTDLPFAPFLFIGFTITLTPFI